MADFNKSIAVLGLLFVSIKVLASDEFDHDQARRLVESGVIIPLSRVLHKAQSVHQGKIIETELEKKRGRLIYEIEILDDKGQVWEMKFDATDGRLLESEKED